RIILVLLMAFGLVLGSLVAPAAATTSDDDGSDLETVRAQTLNTIDYKIGLLTNLKNETDNADRKVVYDRGIARLQALRVEATGSDSIDALRAMDAEAHAIYHETKAEAAAVGQTEEEKIAEARKAALDTINYKLGYFRDAKAKTDNPAHQEIYGAAIGELEKLKAAAEASSDVEQLYGLKAQAHKIYDATKRAIAEAGDTVKEDPPKEDPPKVEEKTEAQKAAEALAQTRRSTLRLIEYKASLFTHAAETAKNPAVADLYTEAAATVLALVADANAAKTIKSLRSIDAQVMEIYEATKQSVADAHDQPGWQPSESVVGHVQALGSVIDRLVGVAEATADQSPETATAVAKAGAKVKEAIKAVESAAETGKQLDSRWDTLKASVHEFRKAFAAHVLAITGAPDCVNGWHLPG
ncbi:MAG: hypothetical protein U9N78_06390, partial [Actinomycetota bacterium]|nr:hypothetical protein [Actinomycetota bacterium]